MDIPDSRIIDIAKTKYQAAVDYALHEGNIAWSRFSVIMLAHSIVIFSFAQLINNRGLLTAAFALMLTVGGFVLSLIWLPLTTRSFDYEKYYLLSAREISDKFLNLPLGDTELEDFLAKGERYADSKEVRIQLGRTNPIEKPLKMSPISWFRAGMLTRLIIVLFLLFYVLAFLFAFANLVYLVTQLICTCAIR